MFEWQDAYSVNINEIDTQHKRMFQLGASLYQMSKHVDTQYDSEALMDIIEELCEYTIYHFETEERHFDRYAYPDKENHEKQHRAFIDFLSKLNIDDIEHRTSDSLSNLLNYIEGWITNHILVEDQKFAVQVSIV